jgi:uncharacterized protein YndB with AHSA1/START domain
MLDISHRVAVKSSPAATHQALTTIEGIAGWLTTDTRGDSSAGGAIELGFGSRGSVQLEVLEGEPPKRVAWEVVRGPAEWLGTRVAFELCQEGAATLVQFKHEGWKETSEFMQHCSTEWAAFLMSMKLLLETGCGSPFSPEGQTSNAGH